MHMIHVNFKNLPSFVISENHKFMLNGLRLGVQFPLFDELCVRYFLKSKIFYSDVRLLFRV